MSAASPRDDDIPSPCISVCELDPQSICRGCGRTLAEIARWRDADRSSRLEIRRLAEQRLKAATPSVDPTDRS